MIFLPNCASMADIFHRFSVCLRILRPKPRKKHHFSIALSKKMQPLKNLQYYLGLFPIFMFYIISNFHDYQKIKYQMIRFKYFVHFKQIWSVFNWKPTVSMSPQKFLQNFSQSSRNKKTLETESKNTLLFSMTPTGLWKSCGWTSNTRSAGEKFQNAFLVHRGTGVSVLAGPCLSAVIEWTIQRSWVGPYLKFWLVEILKGTTGFPSYQDIVYVLWTRISAYPKPEGTLSPHLDLPPYPKSQSPTRMLLHF